MALLLRNLLSATVLVCALLMAQNAKAAEGAVCTITETKFEVYADEKTGQTMGRFQRIEIGGVYRLGSLAVRVAGREHGNWLLDLKAPGFAVRNQQFGDDKPLTYTICGQEVTITVSYKPGWDATVLMVSVF